MAFVRHARDAVVVRATRTTTAVFEFKIEICGPKANSILIIWGQHTINNACKRVCGEAIKLMAAEGNQNRPMWKLAMKEHAQMLGAIDARDPFAARRVLAQHLLRKREWSWI
jgi:DNA-binding FadR family transcriptional regulator